MIISTGTNHLPETNPTMLDLFPEELVSVCSLAQHVQVDTAFVVVGNHHIAAVEAVALEAARTVVVGPAHTVVVGHVDIAVVKVAHIVVVAVHTVGEGAGHILAVDRVAVDHNLTVGSIRYKKLHITVYMKYISPLHERIQRGFAK